MSYNISFRVKVEGIDVWVDVGNCDANITWNVRDIITKSTGLKWENEASNGLCKDIIPRIQKGLIELQTNGKKYKQFEPSNGWGSVKSTIDFFESIISAWNDFVRWNGDLVDVVTFWIV